MWGWPRRADPPAGRRPRPVAAAAQHRPLRPAPCLPWSVCGAAIGGVFGSLWQATRTPRHACHGGHAPPPPASRRRAGWSPHPEGGQTPPLPVTGTSPLMGPWQGVAGKLLCDLSDAVLTARCGGEQVVNSGRYVYLLGDTCRTGLAAGPICLNFIPNCELPRPNVRPASSPAWTFSTARTMPWRPPAHLWHLQR